MAASEPGNDALSGKGLQLSSTEPLRDLLLKAAQNSVLSEEMRQEAAELAIEEKLSWRRLKPIYTAALKARNEEGLHFKEVCKGTNIVRDSPPQPVKNPELIARLQRLQRAEDERKYKEMVHDVTGHERKAKALRDGGLVTYKDQMSYGLHVIIVMAVFYIIGHLAASRLSSKVAMKTAGGLVGLVAAMLMETILLIIRTSGYSKPIKGKHTSARTLLRTPTRVIDIPVEASLQRSSEELKKDR